jgi:hypothetical protein
MLQVLSSGCIRSLLLAALVLAGAGLVEPFRQGPVIEVDRGQMHSGLRRSVEDLLRQTADWNSRTAASNAVTGTRFFN